MDNVKIPDKALKAAARELKMALILAVDEDCRACALTDDECMEAARAAGLAMLRAWPGMFLYQYGDDGSHSIILPLPQENTNAEG